MRASTGRSPRAGRGTRAPSDASKKLWNRRCRPNWRAVSGIFCRGIVNSGMPIHRQGGTRTAKSSARTTTTVAIPVRNTESTFAPVAAPSLRLEPSATGPLAYWTRRSRIAAAAIRRNKTQCLQST